MISLGLSQQKQRQKYRERKQGVIEGTKEIRESDVSKVKKGHSQVGRDIGNPNVLVRIKIKWGGEETEMLHTQTATLIADDKEKIILNGDKIV